jgi:hypothetical protein
LRWILLIPAPFAHERQPRYGSGDPAESRELRTLSWLRKGYADGKLPADIVAYCNAAAGHQRQ